MHTRLINFKQATLFLLAIMLLYFPLTVRAQGEGIRFQDSSWSVLLSEARRTNKLIFVDAYASWCGPCKLMKKNVFTLKHVGAIYNRNFINAYIDMEKGEGIHLSKYYNIRAFPTFLYINGKGEVVHKTVGKCTANEFIQNALDALSPTRNFKYLSANYPDNINNFRFVSVYLKALDNAYELQKANEVALKYLTRLPSSNLHFSGNWQLFHKYVTDPTSAVFRYIVKHLRTFEKLYTKAVVDKKVYDTYLAWPQHYIKYVKNDKPSLDKTGFEAFLNEVTADNYSKKEEVIAKARLTIAFGLRKWGLYSKTVHQMLKDHLIPMDSVGAAWLYSYANKVKRFSKNKNALLAASGWAKIIANDIPHINPENRAKYLNLYATLLEKTGQTSASIAVRKKIDQENLLQAKKSTPFQMLQPLSNKN